MEIRFTRNKKKNGNFGFFENIVLEWHAFSLVPIYDNKLLHQKASKLAAAHWGVDPCIRKKKLALLQNCETTQFLKYSQWRMTCEIDEQYFYFRFNFCSFKWNLKFVFHCVLLSLISFFSNNYLLKVLSRWKFWLIRLGVSDVLWLDSKSLRLSWVHP